MRHTIKFKIQIAIAVIIAVVSGAQAWISVNQLNQETEIAINQEMKNVSVGTTNYIADWLSIRSDMMLANEATVSNSNNSDRELLITKQAGQFLSVYAGFSDGTIAYGDKGKIGQQATILALALGIKMPTQRPISSLPNPIKISMAASSSVLLKHSTVKNRVSLRQI